MVFYSKYQSEYMCPLGLYHIIELRIEPGGLSELVWQYLNRIVALLVYQFKNSSISHQLLSSLHGDLDIGCRAGNQNLLF